MAKVSIAVPPLRRSTGTEGGSINARNLPTASQVSEARKISKPTQIDDPDVLGYANEETQTQKNKNPPSMTRQTGDKKRYPSYSVKDSRSVDHFKVHLSQLPSMVYSRRYTDTPDRRRFTSTSSGRRYTDPSDGRGYSKTLDGRKYTDPADGRRYKKTSDGRVYLDSSERRGYTDPSDGRRYTDSSDRRKYLDPSGERRYTETTDRMKHVSISVMPIDLYKQTRDQDGYSFDYPEDYEGPFEVNTTNASTMARPIGYRELKLFRRKDKGAESYADAQTQVDPQDIEKTGALLRGIVLDPFNVLWPTSGDFSITKAERIIEDYVTRCWKICSQWAFHVEFLQTIVSCYRNKYIFEVKFSMPTAENPIPVATASVYFIFDVEIYGGRDESVKVHYVLEGTRYPHVPGGDFQEIKIN